MLQAVSSDTKKATARGNSQPPSAPDHLLAPPVPVLGNQAALRLRRKCDCGGGPDCDCDMANDRKQKEKESPKTALHRAALSPSKPSQAPPIVHETLRSSGQTLDPETQAFFEARFGQDFSQVRVHADARASESARAVNALAYTVGSSIVFGSHQYSPGTAKGRQLLAHELTHVTQDNQTPPPSGAPLGIGPDNDEHERHAERVSRQVTAEANHPQGAASHGARPAVLRANPAAPRLRRQAVPETLELASGAFVGDIAGAGDNVREDLLKVMDRLHILWALPDIAYALEYPAVATLPAGSAVPQATIPQTIAALAQAKDPTLNVAVANAVFAAPITDEVGAGKPNKKPDILELQDRLAANDSLASTDYAVEHTVVAANPSPTVADATIPHTLQGITKAKRNFVAGEIRKDVLAGTHAVTPTQHADVEVVLNPGSTIAPAAPVPIGVTPPPPVVHPPPALTGAGAGGPLETEMLKYLKDNIGGWATKFRALKAAGPPSFPIANANNIAVAAQGEVERYFGPYVKTAGRGPGDKYHPETYSLISKLGDESTRPLNNAILRDWLTSYFETLRAPNCLTAKCSQEILDTHHFFAGRDQAELDRITTVYLATPSNVTDVEDTIHGWPAEAGTGTVFIQPYQANLNPLQKRQDRWQLFTRLIHEMMHILSHPNFEAAANAIGGSGLKILKEGFAEVMRTELWSGPGSLKTRLANAELASLRQQVEGASLPYNATAVVDSGYYDQLADAQQIDAKVGHANAKAAFFLGQVELLGLGAGTSTEPGKTLTGIAAFSPTDQKDAEIVVAQPGDTYASIADRTGAAFGGLRDETTGAPLPPIFAISAGVRVKVPGIRWVAAVKDNTLASVAEQNQVSVAALAKANQLPAASPGNTPLLPPKRILIPIHTNLP
jgi:hypothetical protein